MAASLPQPGWDCLLDPSAGWEAGEGGWRMTQSGPQGGVRRFLLWQVQAKGVEMMLVPVVLRGNRDGAIKTQRHGLIVKNRVCPTKNIKVVLLPLDGGGRGD